MTLTNYYESFETLHVGTCPPRAHYIPEGSKTLLNGDWAFGYYKSPREVPEAFWNSLPDDLKKIFVEGDIIRRDSQRKFAKAYDEQAIEAIKKTTLINELTDAEVKQFRDLCAPVYNKYKAAIGAELVDKVLKAIQ